jgi:MFS-type transporter involved in bile tolerance (Atg22 family)
MTERLLLAYGLIALMILMGSGLLIMLKLRRRRKRNSSGRIHLRVEK